MTTATFDSDGYPTNNTLDTISNWVLKDQQSIIDFFKFAESAYNKHYGCWKIINNYNDLLALTYEPFTALKIATGGWSSNESVIQAMKANTIWYIAWVVSARGGLYILNMDTIIKK